MSLAAELLEEARELAAEEDRRATARIPTDILAPQTELERITALLEDESCFD